MDSKISIKNFLWTMFLAFLSISCSYQKTIANRTDKAVVFKDWTLNLEKLVLVEDPGKEPLEIVWNVGEEPTIWDEEGRFSGDSFVVHYKDGKILGQIFARPVMEDSNTIIGSKIILKDPTGNEVLWEYNPKTPLFYGTKVKVVFDEEGSRLFIAIFHPLSTGSGLVCLDAETGREIWTGDVEQLFVGHSRYKNEVFIRLLDGRIVMAGDEAGGYYLQVFDAGNGARLFSEIKKTW